MLKSRSGGAKTFHTTYDLYSDGNLVDSGFSGDPFTEPPTSWERIEYTNGYRRYNSCNHIKYLYTPYLDRNPIFQYHSPPAANNTHRDYYSEGMKHSVLGPASPPQPPAPQLGINQFILRGLEEGRPKFKAELSVPNFLWELKDLKRLVPKEFHLSNLAETFSKVGGNPFSKVVSGSARRARNRVGESASTEVASQYLNAQFGYLPLIADSFKLMTAFEDFNYKLAKFRRDGKKLQTTHFKEEVDRSEVLDVETASNFHTLWTSDTTFSKVYYTMTFRYDYEILLNDLRAPALFRKYIGFRDNPRILWDAIPFSFLIDWLLRVGKALESFDDGALPLAMTIRDACVSTRYSCVRDVNVTDIPNSVGSLNFGVKRLMAKEGWIVYDRRIIDPFLLESGIPPLPVTDKLSVKEITLGLALGRTFLKR